MVCHEGFNTVNVCFTCKNCGRQLAVDVAFVGRDITCVDCNKSQTVPCLSTLQVPAKSESTDVVFPCDKCGQQLVVSESGAGLVIPCPSCGFGIIIRRKCPFCLRATRTSAINCEHCGRAIAYNNIDCIDALDFSGSFRNSMGARYTVAWGTGPAGGYPTMYLLLQNGALLLRGTRTNIQDAAVAENGTFLLVDASPAGLDIVTVFDVTGRRLKQTRARCAHGATFNFNNGTCNLEIPADLKKYPSGQITFHLIDGNIEVVKPCCRAP